MAASLSRGVTASVFALAAWAALATAPAWGAALPIEQDPINYLTAPTDDPVARLQKRIDRGEVKLEHDGARGYLAAVLKELGISPTSQTLVFSKTSFQQARISPRSPRALYYGD